MIFASQAGNIVFKSKFLMATMENLKIRENRMRQSRMDNMCYSESSSDRDMTMSSMAGVL